MKFKSKTNIVYEIDVDDNDKIWMIKRKFSEQIHTRFNNITLVFQCIVLEDEFLIKDYNIPSDDFVLFYMKRSQSISHVKSAFSGADICECGHFKGPSCLQKSLIVNIANFTLGIIYNIQTLAGERISKAVKKSRFRGLSNLVNRLIYNNYFIDEYRNFLYYGIKDGDIIKQINVSIDVDDEDKDEDIFDSYIYYNDETPIWQMVGLNTKDKCDIVWVNFLNNNYEYFTAREEWDSLTVSKIIQKISIVFAISTEHIKIFQDKDQTTALNDENDLKQVFSRKVTHRFIVKGGSQATPCIKSKKVMGYQHYVNIYYAFNPNFLDLIQLDTIGRGSFGAVYKCIEIESNRILALKKFKILSNETEKLAAFNIEIDIMCTLGDHPRIVKFERKIVQNNSIYILMEFMPGGSLRRYLTENGALNESQIARFSEQIVEALHYLHGRRIIHRDIKGDNILLDNKNNVKLGDFGLSKNLIEKGTREFHMGATKSFVGTYNFMAPEVITGKQYGCQADIWSFGATVVEMLTGKPPYHNLEHFNVIFKLGTEGKIEFECPEDTNPLLLNFIDICLKADPCERATVYDLMDHYFLKET